MKIQLALVFSLRDRHYEQYSALDECILFYTEQADCPGTKLYASQPLEPPPPLAENRPGVSEDEKLEEPKPIRPLADLRWPVLDDKQSAVFFDPLRRDEVKPLRKFEWEAIGQFLRLTPIAGA